MPSKKTVPTTADVLVLGGGPAGSTMASTLLTHAPETRVVLVEKEKFPRYHIGESLLLDSMRILREIGVYDKVEAGGFLKKIGSTYVWGQDREPWSVNFGDFENIAATEANLPRLPHAFQVDRSAFDKILLDHAATKGAQVFQETKVVDLIWEEKTLKGAVVQTKDGKKHKILADLVADCTGLSGVVSRSLGLREMDGQLNNVAIHAYYEGKNWEPLYTRHPEFSHIFICSVPQGWVWCIPLSQKIISIGLVMPKKFSGTVSTEKGKQMLDEVLANTPELARLLKGAKRLKSFRGNDREVSQAADWSYTSKTMAGPGWVLCGDAAGFLDPILSTGCHFAMTASYLAAYTHLTSKDLKRSDQNFYWREYSRFYKEILSVYREMARYWYRNNASVPGWWSNAKKWLTTSQVTGAEDLEAFIALIGGFTSGEAFHSYAKDLEGYGLSTANHVAKNLMGRVGERPPRPKPKEKPNFLYSPQFKKAAMLARGEGRMVTTTRLTFAKLPKGLPRFERLLSPAQTQWLELVDGNRNAAELSTALKKIQHHLKEDSSRGQVQGLDILADLKRMGVLEYLRG